MQWLPASCALHPGGQCSALCPCAHLPAAARARAAGYSRTEAARHPYPLLLLNDGQNLFDDSLSFSGCSWRAGEAASQLITAGQLPPFLVAGIDHAGPSRSFDYLPYKPGTGPGAVGGGGVLLLQLLLPTCSRCSLHGAAAAVNARFQPLHNFACCCSPPAVQGASGGMRQTGLAVG